MIRVTPLAADSPGSRKMRSICRSRAWSRGRQRAADSQNLSGVVMITKRHLRWKFSTRSDSRHLQRVRTATRRIKYAPRTRHALSLQARGVSTQTRQDMQFYNLAITFGSYFSVLSIRAVLISLSTTSLLVILILAAAKQPSKRASTKLQRRLRRTRRRLLRRLCRLGQILQIRR